MGEYLCVGFYQLQTIESLTETCLSKKQDRGDWTLDSFSHLCFLWTGLMLRLYVAASPQQSWGHIVMALAQLPQ